jgi:hypothetical protein
MKKTPYALRLYLSFFLVVLSIVLTIVLNHTNSLLQDPKTTGEEFLSSMPYVQWGDFILIQPSSTFFVYFLGLVLIVLGCYLIQTAKGNKSRLDYGIGYALWGVSAILAGTSYQAFGYELKYAGRSYGLFTSVFELLYMITTAEAILYLLAGTSYYATTNPKIQKALPYVAIAYGLIYGIVFLIGVALPIQTIVDLPFLCGVLRSGLHPDADLEYCAFCTSKRRFGSEHADFLGALRSRQYSLFHRLFQRIPDRDLQGKRLLVQRERYPSRFDDRLGHCHILLA